jgi:hypothetical protein
MLADEFFKEYDTERTHVLLSAAQLVTLVDPTCPAFVRGPLPWNVCHFKHHVSADLTRVHRSARVLPSTSDHSTLLCSLMPESDRLPPIGGRLNP